MAQRRNQTQQRAHAKHTQKKTSHAPVSDTPAALDVIATQVPEPVDPAQINSKTFVSGFVALIGRPNAGKSSLINALMGRKLAITSNTAQTTRHRFRAVLTRKDYQEVFVDTPGIHKPHDVLGEELNTSAFKALEGIDIACFLVDASHPVGKGDEWITQHLADVSVRKILVLTKTDLVDENTLATQREAALSLASWDAVCELSSKTGAGVREFSDKVADFLPRGPMWFPVDMDTDQALDVIIAEFIREKILRSFTEEIPHAIGVAVDNYEYDAKKDLYRIYASIFCERESQKGMIIGKGGRAIKRIGIESRQDLEQLLGCRVFLDLKVKVREKWRKDLNQIRRFGYGEGL